MTTLPPRLARALRLVVLTLLTAAGARADEAMNELPDGGLTNLALLRSLVNEAVGEMLAGVSLERGETVVVVPAQHHAANRIVADEMSRQLVGAGHPVRILDVAPGPDGSGGAAPEDGGTSADGEEAPTAGAADEENPATDSDAATTDSDAAAPAADDATTAADDAATDSGATGEEDATPGGGGGSLLSGLVREQAKAPGGATAASGPGATPAMQGGRDRWVVFRIDQYAVRYVRTGRSFFFGQKTVDRAGAVNLSCRVLEGETVTSVGQGQGFALDAISRDFLGAYESDGITPTRIEAPGAGRYVEPVVVGGVVVSLVYLFYTNQN